MEFLLSPLGIAALAVVGLILLLVMLGYVKAPPDIHRLHRTARCAILK